MEVSEGFGQGLRNASKSRTNDWVDGYASGVPSQCVSTRSDYYNLSQFGFTCSQKYTEQFIPKHREQFIVRAGKETSKKERPCDLRQTKRGQGSGGTEQRPKW